MPIEIRKLGTQIGAEITGVDVKSLDEASFSGIYRAWLEFGVIAVRDQSLEVGDFVKYSRRFGHVVVHPTTRTQLPGFPEITLLGMNKFDADGKLRHEVYARGGEEFHTDGSYEEIPYKATQLYAVAIPTIGGDTLFASAYAAYDALPQRLKRRLNGLRGVYRYGGIKKRAMNLLDEQNQKRAPVVHALVRVHPETGRKALYIDPHKLLNVEGLPDAESKALVTELRGYMLQPDAQYRHKWGKGDIVIWDNRCLYHKAAADYPPEQDRIHWRVSIQDPKEIEHSASAVSQLDQASH